MKVRGGFKMHSFFDLTDNQSLTAKVYRYIRDGLIEGRYHTGEYLVETKLAEELGVSRTPIREALKQLEQEGLVLSIPNRGMMAQVLSLQDIDDIFTIRLALEGLAAYWAAERVNAEELNRLSELLDMMEIYTRRNNAEQLAELDSEFHDAIYTASNSRVLKHVLLMLHQYSRHARRSSLTMKNRPGKSFDEHRQIFEAIAQHRPEEAKQLMEEHVLHASHKKDPPEVPQEA